MTASLMFINAIEEAVEKDEPLHVSSWDITRAFDSVSKNIIRLAWSRLGVPASWVQWLVGLDERGTLVVRTPHAIRVWDRHKSKGIKIRSRNQDCDKEVEDTMEGFIAERGT